jgi:hypothetical protein
MSALRNRYGEELYEQIFACGHSHHLPYFADKSLPCRDCKREEGLNDAKEVSEGWAGLSGSPRQIEWAIKIRAELIRQLEIERSNILSFNEDDQIDALTILEHINSRARQLVDAKWWIDHREEINIRAIFARIKSKVERTSQNWPRDYRRYHSYRSTCPRKEINSPGSGMHGFYLPYLARFVQEAEKIEQTDAYFHFYRHYLEWWIGR